MLRTVRVLGAFQCAVCNVRLQNVTGFVTTVKILFKCCMTSAFHSLIHTHTNTHTYTRTRAHVHTHTHTYTCMRARTHTLPSVVLKPSKMCTLRFRNTPLYSLHFPPPKCLLLGFVRGALRGYSLPVSKK